MSKRSTPVRDLPVAHVDDSESLEQVTVLLARIHGPDYQFRVRSFRGALQMYPIPGRLVACFFINTHRAGATLYGGDLVRGPDPGLQGQPAAGGLFEVTLRCYSEVWPGDTLCVDGRSRSMAALSGQGTFLEISAPLTEYQAPRLTLLRNLVDRPGGCAAYPGAFRREALPPVRPATGASDERGVNRVNMHALDMRTDREPPPSRHHHGPVPVSAEMSVPHTETALVLSREIYGLPDHADGQPEKVVLYRYPMQDPSDQVEVPVKPGSIVVTPGAADWTMGHSFENAFAMLVAIPGFVSPYRHLT